MKKILIAIFALCISGGLLAQKKCDKLYELYKYEDAIKCYKNHLNGNPNDYEALKKLANSYDFVSKPQQAYAIYKRIVVLQEAQPQDFYLLARNCITLEKMAEAQQIAQQYKQRAPGQKADFLMTAIQNRSKYLQDKMNYAVDIKTAKERLSVNANLKYGNGYIVTALTKKKKNPWNKMPFTQLNITDANLIIMKPLFVDKNNDAQHESFASIRTQDNTIYFTENYAKDKKAGGAVLDQHLKIQSASLKGNGDPTNRFRYNSPNYNTAHPAVSPNGQYLIFSSDRPGGKGGMDLYLCKFQSGRWSSPVSLNAINSYGNEMYPKFLDDNTLSFSSDAFPGLGGLDIFTTTFANGTVQAPVNIGAPMNSSYDDFCLETSEIYSTGYLSSNRNSKGAVDDIFYYSKKSPVQEVVAPVKEDKKLTIMVLDKLTNIPIRRANVVLKKADGSIYKTGRTDDDGRWKLDALPTGTTLDVEAELNGVKATTAKISEADYKTEDKVIVKKLIHNDVRFTLLGHAKERKTGAPLSGVKVKLDNESQGIGQNENTGDDGSFFFQLEQKSDFSVKGIHDGLYSNNVAISTKGLDRSTQLYAKLLLNLDKLCIEEEIPIEDIFYDYDKWDIRSDAKKSLNNLVDLLNQYSDMKIELGSHTDIRGSAEYNRTLAQKRAESAVRYILSKGIAKNRVVAKGYGEDKLKVECEPCSEIQHQSNRRTEVRILSCPSCPSCD